MIWHIIARENKDDEFSPNLNLSGESFYLNLDDTDKTVDIQNNLRNVFDSYGAYPSEDATDLLILGIAIYFADKSISRAQAFNKWSRYIHLYQPVSNLDLWDDTKEKLEKALDFLTGDHWEIHFRKANHKHLVSPKQTQSKLPNLEKQPKTVALMSGGLDSFTGAIDLLETESENVIFVSHYNRSGVTKPVQDRIYLLLERYYPNRFRALQFFVQPSEGITGEVEPSQRSRSFLFLSLGVAVSSTGGGQIPLHIYENGLLSLNVPLNPNRGGGLSTRTTHPYFLSLYQNILESLGIAIRITTPFRFATKGEMLLASKNSSVLQEGIKMTHSCSHINYVRFKGQAIDSHCGYCLPCIVRRAATKYAMVDDVYYVVDVTGNDIPANRVEGKDIYAVKIALQRLATMSSSLISHVRTTGPIPGTPEEIAQYVDVYRRGMEELGRLIG